MVGWTQKEPMNLPADLFRHLRHPLHATLAMLLAIGILLRLHALLEFSVATDVVGDALEYNRFTQDLLLALGDGTMHDIRVDRTPGLPLILAPLFGTFGASAFLQRIVTTGLSVLVLVLTATVARRSGPMVCLVATALVAVSPALVEHAPLGLTEELFSALLLLCIWITGAESSKPLAAAKLGICCSWLVLTKMEGFLSLVPLVAAFLQQVAHRGRSIAGICALYVLLPSVAALAAYRYLVHAAGLLPIDLRGGNYLFFREFLTGRMPWGYMRDLRNPGFQISYTEWLFDYHNLAGIVALCVEGAWEYLLLLSELLT